MSLSKREVKEKYQSGAKHYDKFLKIYPLIGFRMEAYRSRVIELLRLKRGDSVVELGCGTGLNFPHIIERIGPEGRLIGVDIASKMLKCAKEKVDDLHWDNVELVQSDVEVYSIPKGVNKILSTGVFGFVAEYDRVIRAASQALAPNGRIVIMDGKKPGHWPLWLLKLFVWLGQPFGLTLSYLNHQTWESMERYLQETTFEEMYGGLIYISSGTARLS